MDELSSGLAEEDRTGNGTGSQECKKSAVFLKQHFYP